MLVSSINSLVSTAQTSGIGAAKASAPTGGIDFGKVLADVASQAINTVKASEATAIAGIQGQASVQGVVQAVMSAEQTLHTVIAVRDKAVAAYQEITRMAI